MIIDFLSGPGDGLFDRLRWNGIARANASFCEFEDGRYRSFTYGELLQSLNSVSNGLLELGVGAGDYVGVYVNNRTEFFPIVLGAMRIGAVFVPFSVLYAQDEVVYQLEHARIKVLFIDEAFYPALQSRLHEFPDLKHVIVVGASPEGVPRVTFNDLLLYSSEEPIVPVPDADELALIMYTSGTTDRPKGVMWSHGNLQTMAETFTRSFGWSERDRLLHYFPLYHANGGLGNMLPIVWTGASMFMLGHFSASRFTQQLVEHRITKTNVTATNLRMLLRAEPAETDTTHMVRYMRLGLTASSGDIHAFEKRFNTRLVPAYGVTEACGVMVAFKEDSPPRPGSSGKVLRGYRVRLIDDDGDDVAPGEPGEVLIQGTDRHGITMGYFRDPERTATFFRDGWLHTGDVGRFDEDGYFWFIERRKDMIKRSGFNVAPAEVERVIGSLEGVFEVAVVGIPEVERDEAIVAFVVMDGTSSLSEVQVLERCSRDLARYKVPQMVVFPDTLPKNHVAKIDRKQLREVAREKFSSRVQE